ncbi:MAG: hypothetical protein AAF436_22080 [Myxococcota bacterium]
MNQNGVMRSSAAVLLALATLGGGCGDDSSGAGGTGGTDTNCAAVCDNEVECNDTPRIACEGVCDLALESAESVSQSCFNAVNAVLGCAGSLSCADYEAWQNETPADGFPCRAETETCDAECNNLCDEEFDF